MHIHLKDIASLSETSSEKSNRSFYSDIFSMKCFDFDFVDEEEEGLKKMKEKVEVKNDQVNLFNESMQSDHLNEEGEEIVDENTNANLLFALQPVILSTSVSSSEGSFGIKDIESKKYTPPRKEKRFV